MRILKRERRLVILLACMVLAVGLLACGMVIRRLVLTLNNFTNINFVWTMAVAFLVSSSELATMRYYLWCCTF